MIEAVQKMYERFHPQRSDTKARTIRLLDEGRSSQLFQTLAIAKESDVFGSAPSITRMELLPPHVLRVLVAGQSRCFTITDEQRQQLEHHGIRSNDYPPRLPQRYHKPNL